MYPRQPEAPPYGAEAGSGDSHTNSAPQPASQASNNPVLAAYIREVSKQGLLSRENESELFNTLRTSREAVRELMERLDHLFDKNQHRVVHADTLRYEEVAAVWEELPRQARNTLDARDRHTLQRQLAAWNTARERLLKSNLRLVIYTVKRFRNEPSLFMDLIQEGNIGLMRAVDRYDPDRSSRFSTYALWWIWQAVNRAYAKNVHTIRIPVYKVQQVGRVQRKRQALAATMDRTPTDQEVADAVGLSPEEAHRISEVQTSSISLDEVSGEEMVAMSEYLTSPEHTPDALVMHLDMYQALRGALDRLPSREAQVLRWRYGLDSDVFTLQEIGTRLSVSRERVRQLEQQAIGRLARSDDANHLAEHYGMPA